MLSLGQVTKMDSMRGQKLSQILSNYMVTVTELGTVCMGVRGRWMPAKQLQPLLCLAGDWSWLQRAQTGWHCQSSRTNRLGFYEESAVDEANYDQQVLMAQACSEKGVIYVYQTEDESSKSGPGSHQ